MNPNICHDRKIVFVHNPKVAGTSLRDWLGFDEVWNHGFPTTNTPVECWNDYRVIVAIRDPIDRALSGYRFMTREKYVGSFRSRYPDLPTWDPLTFFRKMFNEQIFVVPPQFKYTMHMHSNKAPDYLIRFENMDLSQLAQDLDIQKPLPRENANPQTEVVDIAEDLYVALIDHYKVDYLLFGYRPVPYRDFMRSQEKAAAA
ncbi:hypothetical protein ROS1_48780 [Roseibium sp. ROS1]|jgi:hypothetical protein